MKRSVSAVKCQYRGIMKLTIWKHLYISSAHPFLMYYSISLSLSLSLHLWLCACACTYARIFYVSRNVSCSHYIVYILNRIVNRVVLCRPNLSAPNNNKQEPHTLTQLGHNGPNRRLTTNNPMPPIPNKTHNNLCKDD